MERIRQSLHKILYKLKHSLKLVSWSADTVVLLCGEVNTGDPSLLSPYLL